VPTLCIFCLLPNKLSTAAAEQLHEFDLMDDVIWNTVKSSWAACCSPRTSVLEYCLLCLCYDKHLLPIVANMRACQSPENFVMNLPFKVGRLELWRLERNYTIDQKFAICHFMQIIRDEV
jgi:hypothetical protein